MVQRPGNCRESYYPIAAQCRRFRRFQNVCKSLCLFRFDIFHLLSFGSAWPSAGKQVNKNLTEDQPAWQVYGLPSRIFLSSQLYYMAISAGNQHYKSAKIFLFGISVKGFGCLLFHLLTSGYQACGYVRQSHLRYRYHEPQTVDSVFCKVNPS